MCREQTRLHAKPGACWRRSVYPPRFLEVARELELTPADPRRPGAASASRGRWGRSPSCSRCDPSNVTGIADALEARKLARRRPSEADRRVKVIELTAAGERMRGRVMARAERAAGLAQAPLGGRPARRSATCSGAPTSRPADPKPPRSVELTVPMQERTRTYRAAMAIAGRSPGGAGCGSRASRTCPRAGRC